LDLFSDLTPEELRILKSTLYGPSGKEARQNMSKAAKERWGKMSEEDKDAYLRTSFHSKESIRKMTETTRQIWKNKTPEEIEKHVRSSFLRPEVYAASRKTLRRHLANMSSEEKKVVYKSQLEGSRNFWSSPQGEVAREKLRSTVSQIWSDKSPEERQRWLSSSCQSPEANEARKAFWKNLSDEDRRAFGQRVVESKIERGTLADGKTPNFEEYFLGMYLETLYPGMFEYNGSGFGKKVIGRRIPDFISRNGENIVVELFGTYWHPESDEKDRIDHYSKFGYKCVVIWDYENLEGIVKEKLDNVKDTELSGKKYIGSRSMTEGGD